MYCWLVKNDREFDGQHFHEICEPILQFSFFTYFKVFQFALMFNWC